MTDSDMTSASHTKYYHHNTLDYGTTSIRLVQIRQLLSMDGLIQCAISQQKLHERYQDGVTGRTFSIATGAEDVAGVQHSYTCLSYTWGNPHDQVRIRVNGRLFKVRKSLWEFLNIARRTLYDTYLWIDALSIDQDNTLERNHQVQQMGRIYSGAETVLTWLGNEKTVEDVLKLVNMAERQPGLLYGYEAWNHHPQLWTSRCANMRELRSTETSDYEFGSWSGYAPSTSAIQNATDNPNDTSNILSDTTGKVEALFAGLSENEYWSRAWVTQEVLLGKSTTVVAGRQAHSLLSLASKYRTAVPYFKDSAFENLIDLVLLQHKRKKKLSGYSLATGLEEWGVIQLLHRFRNKQCAIRRDRIYSLIALSKEAEALKVDYEISEEHVMRQILTLRASSLCLCSASIAAESLAPWSFPALYNESEERPFAELHMYSFALSSRTCPCCFNWVPFSWTRKKGLVFCLGTACPDTQGHIFWEQVDVADRSDAIEVEEKQLSIANAIYAQLRQNNRSQLLCENGAGISIVPSQWEHVYLLRFSLRLLIEVLQYDTTAGNLDLNTCGNLWPNDPNQRASGLAKLRLCDEE